MGSETKIQWADHTFNPWRGCTKVAPGCANCYAEALSKRNPGTLGVWGPNGTRIVASEAMWREPLKWDREAAKTGERPRVFCASLADVFEDWGGSVNRGQSELAVCHGCGKFGSLGETIECGGGADLCRRMPRRATLDDVRARLFRLIDQTPNLDWLLLTKRPENIRRMWRSPSSSPCMQGDGVVSHDYVGDTCRRCGVPHRENLWLGVSIACRADLRLLDELRKCRDVCAKTFVSAEPLLEDLGTIDLTGIDWVIVGGESGLNARPCDVAHVRSIVRQCRSAGVPPYVKQLGAVPFAWDEVGDYDAPASVQRVARDIVLRDPKGGDPAEWPEDLRVREVPTCK